ncbi:Hpt domain-containing protein [Cloacibacillus evryensis]|uniref:Hpt domain-containing protein n=1 Tax=Cloacibacillus evryensis TaxID=508460 RepID=UPI00370D9CDF
MKKLYGELKRWGCDVDGALERVVGDDELYMDCLRSIARDEAFFALGDALRAGDRERAFYCAHTLKGVLANLGLIPIYDIVVRIVEPLRAEETDGVLAEYEKLLESRGRLEKMVGNTVN